MTPAGLPAAISARWQTLHAREKSLVLAAATLVALALLWWVGIAPALKTLRQADVQQRSLDTQWQQMQALAAEARLLQSRPRIKHEEAVRALEASVSQALGPGARLTIAGERATLTLNKVPAAALAQWLAQARTNARVLPSEARLVRSPTPPGAAGAAWDGTMVLNLPPR